MNPFDVYINRLYGHLNILIGFLYVLENQLANFRSMYEQALQDNKIDKTNPLFGKCLVIRDLSESTENGWPFYYPTGKFILNGQEYLDIIETLISRESSWTVSQAYESFETFLKDISAYFLFVHQDNEIITDSKITKYDESLLRTKTQLSRTDFLYWRDFVKFCYGNNAEILKSLRAIAPGIKTVEKANNRSLDLTRWFEVVTEVRHAITHSDSLIKSDRIASWIKDKRELLSKYFPTTINPDGFLLQLKQNNVEECLTFFLEYAHLIYKAISIQDGYDWYDVLLKKRSP